ncbi:nucleotidyltransferase family protein [Neobacillus mesonae]|nr:nucleotidyltransferase family protein [Neobacillus mesonae]
MHTAGIILAAGSSLRMGESKVAIALCSGVSMGAAVVSQALSSELDFVIVVAKPEDSLTWLNSYKDRVSLTVCKDAHLGMAYSLRHGIELAKDKGADSAVILLGDQPLLRSNHINRLIYEYMSLPRLDYVAAQDRDELKPPILLSKSMFESVSLLKGDEGARRLIRGGQFEGRGISFEQDVFFDADTREELDIIQEKLRLHKD